MINTVKIIDSPCTKEECFGLMNFVLNNHNADWEAMLQSGLNDKNPKGIAFADCFYFVVGLTDTKITFSKVTFDQFRPKKSKYNNFWINRRRIRRLMML